MAGDKVSSEKSVYVKQVFFLVSSVVLSSLLVVFSYFSYSKAKSDYDEVVRAVEFAEASLKKATIDKALLQRYSSPFLNLQASNFFGEEDRLLWSETLKSVAKERKLPGLRYSINPQQKVVNLGGGFSPKLVLLQSMMEVDAGLGHEGDFLAIMRSLASLPAMVRINHCALKKSRLTELSVEEKNIELSCTLAWFTASQLDPNDRDAIDVVDVGDPI